MFLHKINVLHVVLTLNVGGLERFLLEFVAHLPEEIHSHIACIEKKGALVRHLGDFPVFELNKPKGIHISCAYRIAKLIRENGIDLVHTHNPAPHFYGSFAGAICRVPVLHTKHGRNNPDDRGEGFLARISNLMTDLIVPVSNDAAALCLSRQNVNPAKVVRIYNGIDVSRFKHNNGRRKRLREFGIGNGCIVAGMVARICEDKDHKTLIESIKGLALPREKFHLLIIGDGSLRLEMERLAESLGVDKYMTFTGMRDDVPELLSELDMCILSSHTEGHSITLLEAMAAGLPCIATAVGGNPEVVEDGVTGFLVPHENPQSLAQKILFLAQDADMARTMGNAGRRRVAELFDIRQTASRYVECYRSLVARKEA